MKRDSSELQSVFPVIPRSTVQTFSFLENTVNVARKKDPYCGFVVFETWWLLVMGLLIVLGLVIIMRHCGRLIAHANIIEEYCTII